MSIAKTKLKGILKEYKDEFDKRSMASRDAYIKNLRPGESIPTEGRIYNVDNHREYFSQRCIEIRAKADAVLDGEINAIRAKKSEAPTTEAVNAITLAAARQNINKDDIDDLIRGFGNNYQSYRSIQDLAQSHHIEFFEDHPLAAQEQSLSDLKHSIDKYIGIDSADAGRVSGGYPSFLEMTIDSVIPD